MSSEQKCSLLTTHYFILNERKNVTGFWFKVLSSIVLVLFIYNLTDNLDSRRCDALTRLYCSKFILPKYPAIQNTKSSIPYLL